MKTIDVKKIENLYVLIKEEKDVNYWSMRSIMDSIQTLNSDMCRLQFNNMGYIDDVKAQYDEMNTQFINLFKKFHEYLKKNNLPPPTKENNYNNDLVMQPWIVYMLRDIDHAILRLQNLSGPSFINYRNMGQRNVNVERQNKHLEQIEKFEIQKKRILMEII